MSDMSFKQAKELVERMEFSEIALRKAADDFEKSSQNFQSTLKYQEDIINKLPNADKKLSYMLIAVAVNIGLIIGIFCFNGSPYASQLIYILEESAITKHSFTKSSSSIFTSRYAFPVLMVFSITSSIQKLIPIFSIYFLKNVIVQQFYRQLLHHLAIYISRFF
jgi:hypothetical protein